MACRCLTQGTLELTIQPVVLKVEVGKALQIPQNCQRIGIAIQA